MNFKAAAVATIAACVSGAEPARAATIVTHYVGVMNRGFDDPGYFGPPGRDLSGERVDVEFRLYGERPGSIEFSYDDGGATAIRGSGAATPVTARLRINGATRRFSGFGQQVQDVLPEDGGRFLQEFDQFASDSILGLDALDAYVEVQGATRAANAVPSPNWRTFNRIDFSAMSIIGIFERIGAPGATGFAGGEFTVTSMSIRTVDLPEPSAWSLMILGFGALGSLKRHRRQSQAASGTA